MRQRALTIVAPLAPDTNVDRLMCLLRSDGGGWQGGRHGPFAGLETLHYLSCCVVEAEGAEPTLVVLELNFDGRPGTFLSELVRSRRGEVDRIFGSCEGYPDEKASPERIVEFLIRHRQRENLFYLGHPGRSVTQIRDESALRPGLRAALGRARWTTRAEVWGTLRPRGSAPKPPQLPFLVRYSLSGWRGPKRALELVRAFLWPALLLAGAAAFCGSTVASWRAGKLSVLGITAVAVSIAPALVGLSFFRLSPRHLTAMGSWLVVREALSQGALAFVYSAVGVGLVAALLPGANERWLPFSVWEVLAAGAPWVFGVALVLVVWVASVAAAYLIVGWSLALVVGAFGLGVTLWGTLETLRAATIELRDALLFAVPLLSVALVLTLGGAAVLIYLLRLRRRETEDAVAPARWDNEHLARMTKDEDRQFQNHFASVTTVKDGLRLWQLRAVLRLIQLLGRIYYNQGDLGGIPSIHFARFVVLKEKGRARKRLLFLTNYDGGWPNYLGEFSHVPGVTLVWGSTELFPRPFLLGGDGSRDEQRFKTWARGSQIKTLIWYSAYPDLSVVEVNRNTRVRRSLARRLEANAPRLGPLLRFWRAFRQPLDDAALDEELRSLTH